MRFASLASVLVLLLYGRAQADTLQIKTSYGNGADCGISGDNGIDNPNMGASTTAAARYAGTAPPLTNVRNQKIYLRFDLSQLVPGSISAASLTVVPNNTDTSAGTARVKGLTNGHPGELWGETVITWTNAPGMSGASAANGNGVDYVVATDWVALPNWTFTSVTAGTSKTYAPGAAFINFLNTKSNGSVTIMLDGYTGTVVDSVSIRTKEYDSTNTPYLTLTATPRASLSLASAPNPSVVGSDVVFTATVVTNGLTAGDATGTVVFKDGATPLSTNTLSGGVAAYTNHSLAQGSHTVCAEYSGDSIYLLRR